MNPTYVKQSNSVALINTQQPIDANILYMNMMGTMSRLSEINKSLEDINTQLNALAAIGVYPDATNPNK